MINLSAALGSTILRYAIFAGIALTVFVVFSSVWNIGNLEKQAIYLATEEAKANWNKDEAFRLWSTRHGGVYVRPDERTPPNPYLKHLPNRDVETTDGVRLTLMNPAYMMSQLTKEFEAMYGIKGKITGQILLNPKNQADPWELNALKQFDKGEKEISEQTNIDGQPYIRLMRPVVMKKGCVACHGHLGFKVGDIRGGVSISVPLTPYFGAAEKSKTTLLSTHGVVWSIGMLAIGFVSWRGQKRERERWQAEQKLRKSEEKYRLLTESTSVIPWEADIATFQFTYVGPQAEKLVGYPVEDWYQDDFWPAHIHRNDRKAALACCLEATENHQDNDFEYRMITADGGIVWLRDIVNYISEEDGPDLLRGVMIDISARKRTEEALQESESRLAGILQIAPEGVIAIGEDMTITLFNKGAERIFGYNAEDVLGKNMDVLMPKHFREGHRKHVDGFDHSGETYRLLDQRQEIFGLRKDGTEFPAAASVSKLEIGGEKIFTVMLQDITQRKRAQEDLLAAKGEAENANNVKSEFLAAMSHELRTPLNAILGFADILYNQYLGPPGQGKYREYAGDIKASGEYLLELVNEILDLSTIEAGKQSLFKEKLSTKEVVMECERIIEKKARSLDIDLVTQLPNNLPPLYADRRAAKQILLNLLTNAIKFTPEGGTITVSVKASKQNTTMKIADTGRGITADKLPNLTDPFTRAGNDSYLSEKGWGLGLTITKSLIDLHDGSLDIKSKVGKGTAVTVTWPNLWH